MECKVCKGLRFTRELGFRCNKCGNLKRKVPALPDPIDRVKARIRLEGEKAKLGAELPLRSLIRAEKKWLRRQTIVENKLKQVRRKLRRGRKKLNAEHRQIHRKRRRRYRPRRDPLRETLRLSAGRIQEYAWTPKHV